MEIEEMNHSSPVLEEEKVRTFTLRKLYHSGLWIRITL